MVENAIKIYKGTNPEVDSYSAFWDNQKLTDTKLEAQLRAKNVTDVFVCGVAYDVCVGTEYIEKYVVRKCYFSNFFHTGSTAIDAQASGFRTILVEDCCRGVDLLDIEKTKNAIRNNHGLVLHSSKVKALVEGNDRRPELGYKLALELKKSKEKRKAH